MHWFRSNIRLGARLALLALAVQIALSFGHVHFYALTPTAANAAPAVTAQDYSMAVPISPVGKPKSDGAVGSDCAICALIQLSAASVPAAAPAFLLPLHLEPRRLNAALTLVLAASPRFLFQARAPPSI